MEIAGTALFSGELTPTVATKIPTDDKRRANAVLLTVETNPCRVLFTGNPTATAGHLLTTGTHYFKGSQLVRDITFIDTGSGASKVRYTTMR